MAKALDKEIAVFVKFHLADKRAFAPFTGQDFSAWCAFLYAMQLYGRGDSRGQRSAIDAASALVRGAQNKVDVLACFKKAIPGVLDWGYEATLWAHIAPRPILWPEKEPPTRRIACETIGLSMAVGDANGYIELLWPCSDGARICGHIHSKPSKKHADYFKCRDCDAEWRPADEEARAL